MRAATRIACFLGLVLALFAKAQAHGYTLEALKDEITNLPDAPEGLPRMFSGYIPVNADGSRRIFYWFMESTEPSNVIAYQTNGGPGCSGLIGAFTEWSPIRPIKKNGRVQLAIRDASWNKYANVIYVEQPAGVGFSQAESHSIRWTDDEAASNAHTFVKNWFVRFPQFKTNELILFSESYGGHYLPTLAQKLHHNPIAGVNFRGFIVGNPLTYMPWRDYGAVASLAEHQKVPSNLFAEYLKSGCKPRFDVSPNPVLPRPAICDTIENKMLSYTRGLDHYAINFPTCQGGAESSGMAKTHFLKHVREAGEVMRPFRKALSLMDSDESYFPDYEECEGDYTSVYLSRKDVQAAIHAEKPFDSVNWEVCNSKLRYSSYDMITSMVPIYEELVSSGKYDIMIYSGDNDSVCATSGEQPWLWESKTFSVAKGAKNWAPWYTHLKEGKQVSGYVTDFSYGKGTLQFATVSGAGHMVPSTRPFQSLDLFAKYLGKSKWNQ